MTISKHVLTPDDKNRSHSMRQFYRHEVNHTRKNFFATRSPAQAMLAIQKCQGEADQWVRQSAQLSEFKKIEEEASAETMYRKARVLSHALNQQLIIEHNHNRLIEKHEKLIEQLKEQKAPVEKLKKATDTYQKRLLLAEQQKPYVGFQLALLKCRLEGRQPGIDFEVGQLKKDIKPLEAMLEFYKTAREDYKITHRFIRPTLERVKQDLSRLKMVVGSNQPGI